MKRIGWNTCIFATILSACAVLMTVLNPTPGLCQTAHPVSGTSVKHTPRPVSDGTAVVIGHLNPTLPIRVTLVLTPPLQDELEQFNRDVQDPKSPKFHQFLSLAQWKTRYAPSDGAVQSVIDWGQSSRLTLTHRFGSNLAVVMDGNVQSVEKAFGVSLNKYVLNGEQFYSNDRDPVIPSSLVGIVKDLMGLNGYEYMYSAQSQLNEKHLLAEPRVNPGPFLSVAPPSRGDGHKPSQGSSGRIVANISPGTGNGLEPPDLWSSQGYNYAALQALGHCCNPTHNPGGTPKEQSIAIVGENKPLPSDYQTFFMQYGLAWNITEVMISGPSCCDNEMTLDVEWTGAMSNSFGSLNDTAHIFMYEGGGTQISDDYHAWQQALSDDNARSLTTSFGAYEDYYGSINTTSISAFRDVTNPMAALGWSLAAAAGDHGAYDDCQNLTVQYPATDPNIVAVGGTTLIMNLSGGKAVFGSEVAWTGNGCGGASWPGANNGGGGGGCSNTFFAPSWQLSICPGGRRSVPDIALNAGNGQAFYYSFGSTPGWQSVGGTSIASPEIAGFLAQVNAYYGSLGNICGGMRNSPCVPLGNVAPALYSADFAPHNPYYDVTSGCNSGNSNPNSGYCATIGWDQATGWGSASMLQLAWAVGGFDAIGTPPVVSFGPAPGTNQWYNSEQTVNFTVGSAPMGVAGFTAAWDVDPGDPKAHATPGSGDPFWDGPQVPNGTTGSFSLVAAGLGCHTGYVESWDNTGTNGGNSYGPVCYDNILPVSTCSVPDGLWHATDVAIPCNASDVPSGLANPADANFNLTTSVPNGTETPNAFTNTHTICDKANNCILDGPVGPNKVDKKPPSILISQPTASAYVHSATFVLNYSVTDGGSGVGAVTPTMDGNSMIGGHGLLNGQVVNLLTDLSVGQHTFQVAASDQVGNLAASSVVFSIIVTAQSIMADVQQFVNNGSIDNNGIANSLLVKLNAAQKARSKGNCVEAANDYQAFINEVSAQSGKHISPTAAAILIGDAQYLITHCP